MLVGGLVAAGEQVFGQGAVVEPVDGPVGDGAAFDDERAGVAGQPQQVLVGVAVAGGQGVGQQRPHVFPGQAAALGVGQREQQVHRLRGLVAQAQVQVAAHGRAGGPGQAGPPGRVSGIGDGGLGGLGGGQDPGDEKRVPGRLGDRRGHLVQQPPAGTRRTACRRPGCPARG